jgi:CDGSH-type Zn-finger protein
MERPTQGSGQRPEQSPPTVIRAYADGPLLVRGDFELRDENGEEIDPRRGTIALCRCGHSAAKPFCDGSHTLVLKRRTIRAAADAAAAAPDAADPDAAVPAEP